MFTPPCPLPASPAPKLLLPPSPAARAIYCLLLAWSVLVPGIAARGDQLVLAGDAVLSTVPLPSGAAKAELLDLSHLVREVTYLDDGRRLAVRNVENGDGQIIGYALSEILGDGSVMDLGMIEPPEDAFGGEDPIDLVSDGEGRLFYLAFVLTFWNPPDGYYRLLELDPADGSTLSVQVFDRPTIHLLARAPSGLWAVTQAGLELLDPDTGSLTFVRDFPGFANDGDTDSTGALWLYGEGVCSPPCYLLSRFDPATGSLRAASTPPRLNPSFVLIRDLAISRTCEGSETRLCVQGGRFAVEIDWREFEDRGGKARVTPSRSADSGVFWFFDPANWELTVKVLDACRNDGAGHFWVFASGSTNIEYEITVTDLETDATKTYDNPLGRTAVTVTDTTAFPCDPP